MSRLLTMESHAELAYEQVVAAYWEALTTTLRGFRASPEFDFLEDWVPDDDPLASLLGIIAAAKEKGLSELIVRVGPQTAQRMSAAHLQAAAAKLGTVELATADDGLTVRMAFGPPAVPPLAVHPAYRKKLAAVLAAPSHERRLSPRPAVELVSASDDGATLMALIDPSTNLVRDMAFQGVCSDAQRGVLEAVCRYSVGKPIQECSDHAVLHVEQALRDSSHPAPVPGVILPAANADPAFRVPTRLTRALLAVWRQVSQWHSVENVYDPPVAAAWRALSPADRLSRLQSAMATHPLGRDVAVVRLEQEQRVVLKFTAPLDQATQQSRLMRAEAYLKETIEPTLHVYLEPKVDQNLLRQGKGVTL